MDLPRFVGAVRALAKDADALVEELALPKGTWAVNVHSYALPAYEAFLHRHYADGQPRAAGIAMNPGKFGACQTGMPFTDWTRAETLLPGLEKLVDRDARARAGLPPPHREQSGRRVYAWGAKRFGSDAAMLRRVVFLIPCPIAVLEGERGKPNNVPLDQLPRKQGNACLQLIRDHAPKLLGAADPTGVLLLGAYAEGVWQVLQEDGTAPKVPVGRALHPAAHVPDADIVASLDRAWSRLQQARA
ncbi:MAG: hypothetical protein LC624_12565 [Halobacteriales archaeon]|nr:hypothetical protein [Halobacteriales archaeon]